MENGMFWPDEEMRYILPTYPCLAVSRRGECRATSYHLECHREFETDLDTAVKLHASGGLRCGCWSLRIVKCGERVK